MSAFKQLCKTACAVFRWFRKFKKEAISAHRNMYRDVYRRVWRKEKLQKESPLKEGPLFGAGSGARCEADKAGMWAVLMLGMLFGIIVTLVSLMFSIYFVILVGAETVSFDWVVFLILLFVVIAPVLIFPILYYRIKNYNLGAWGERAVGNELDKLGRPKWRIFHSFDTGRGDIDHIIVCPQGVFCVETKTPRKYPGETMLFKDGVIWRVNTKYGNKRREDSDPIPQVKRNAEWLRDYLGQNGDGEMPVASIITFPGWWVDIEPGHADKDLIPCNPKLIHNIFNETKDKLSAKREDKLSYAQIEKICAALEKKNRTDIRDIA